MTVYYDPRDPSQCVIDREDARTRGAIFSLVGLAFCAIGLAGFYLR